MRIENGFSNDFYVSDLNVRIGKENSDAVAVKEATDMVSNEKRQDVGRDNMINDEMLENAVKEANRNLDQYNKVIERSIHEKTHTIMYVLRDTLTNEVIREFPPRKIQDMIAKMWEIAGILVDERR